MHDTTLRFGGQSREVWRLLPADGWEAVALDVVGEAAGGLWSARSPAGSGSSRSQQRQLLEDAGFS